MWNVRGSIIHFGAKAQALDIQNELGRMSCRVDCYVRELVQLAMVLRKGRPMKFDGYVRLNHGWYKQPDCEIVASRLFTSVNDSVVCEADIVFASLEQITTPPEPVQIGGPVFRMVRGEIKLPTGISLEINKLSVHIETELLNGEYVYKGSFSTAKNNIQDVVSQEEIELVVLFKNKLYDAKLHFTGVTTNPPDSRSDPTASDHFWPHDVMFAARDIDFQGSINPNQ